MISGENYLKFAPRVFFKHGLPLQLIFFVTAKCNLRCRHCFYSHEIERKKEELTLAEIEMIAKNSKLNLLWLLLTGGEPFLRADLAEIASAFCRYGKVANISIPTNGQMKKETIAIVRNMLKLCPDTFISISVSLDGTEKINDNIRNLNGAFSKTIDTFLELKKFKSFSNFGLSLQTTMNFENQNDLKKLYYFARDELKPDYFNLNLIRGSPKDQKLSNVDVEYYEELLDLIEKDTKKGKWDYFKFPFSKIALARNLLVYKQIAGCFRKKQFLTPCYSSNLSGVINETGNVFPCEILQNSKIGNLKEVNYNLSKLWFSPRNNEIRKRIAQNCFCTYECAMSINVLFNLRFYPEIILQSFNY